MDQLDLLPSGAKGMKAVDAFVAGNAATLDAALLSADPETLTDLQRKRRAALEEARDGTRAREGRPSTAGAAERALRLLPPPIAAEIATDRRLRESEAALLAVLCRRSLGDPERGCAPSVPELAATLGCAERTVQLAARALVRKGAIAIEERPIRPGHNDTNRYTVTCRRLAELLREHVEAGGRPPRRLRSGVRSTFRDSPTRGESPSTLRKNLESTNPTPKSHQVTTSSQSQCEPAKQASRPRSSAKPPNEAPRLPRNGTQHELALRALRHVAPELANQTHDPDQRRSVWDCWQRLLDDRMPKFDRRLWHRALWLHRERAWFALAETLLKDQAGQIGNREGYLWGIVKHGIAGGTRHEDCTPEASVAEILEERGAGPEATKAALAVALTAALAKLPKAQQLRYLQRAGPAERRQAGRLARRGDRAGFAAEIARIAGEGDRAAIGPEAYETVRRLTGAGDVAAVEAEWRAWCDRRGLVPDRPEAHFVAFGKSWAARRAS